MVLFLVARSIRDVRLSIDAEMSAIGINDDDGVEECVAAKIIAREKLRDGQPQMAKNYGESY